MDVLIQIAQILFILTILVTLHEFGHYIPAKIFKVRAEKFYLFMDAGFSLFKKKIGETEWGIGWLPLGGYVKLSGMIDESMDEDQMKQEPQPWEFRSKPAWQRLIIMLGGIFVNLLIALVIYTVMYATVGQKYPSTAKYQENGLLFGEVSKSIGFQDGDKIISIDGKKQPRFNRMLLDVLLGEEVLVNRNGQEVKIHLSEENIRDVLSNEGKNFAMPRVKNAVLDSILPNHNAEKAGLLVGDKIDSVNGQPIVYYDQLKSTFKKYKKDSVTLRITRNNAPITLKALVTDSASIGIRANPYGNVGSFLEVNKMSVLDAIPAALEESYTMFVYNIKQFKLILKPKTEAYKQVKSPIGITRILPTTWDWENVFNFMAFFSIALAFMNLLPIPGLDGGHALFTIVEMITGKKLSDKAAGYVQSLGMIILLSFMALVFGKDIYEIILDNFK